MWWLGLSTWSQLTKTPVLPLPLELTPEQGPSDTSTLRLPSTAASTPRSGPLKSKLPRTAGKRLEVRLHAQKNSDMPCNG
ncbi:hypothetical protein BKA70DRAFT_1285261 [Coprinopsis sp. MPI-PUGE-AT-0042]|nr:hypothetical protein BKA70DRAFT_1285261 [Coprinopsis sp. MPI-PUGE-AT-0042]